MVIYVFLEALVGIVAGILIAACTKRSKEISYGTLDKIGIATNILLIPIYSFVSLFSMFIGMISEPRGEGFLWVIGLIICLIVASSTMSCFIGLGCSVALRKKGKSGLSFAIQFLGVIGSALTFALYCIFVGSLISPLN